MMFPNKDVKPIEDYDHRKVEEGEPSGVWLELAFEGKSVAVNPLGFECLVKLKVCDANRTPGEKTRNGGQILKPRERFSWTTFSH
jgi:hypothetical protein